MFTHGDAQVTDLRAELEARALDKAGLKAVLAERLQAALDEEKVKEGGSGGTIAPAADAEDVSVIVLFLHEAGTMSIARDGQA